MMDRFAPAVRRGTAPVARGRPSAPTGRGSPVFLVVLGLAVLTALALVRTSLVLTDPSVPPVPASANGTVVRRFYDAVNDALATGTTDQLVPLLAADVVDHVTPSVVTGDRTTFLARVLRQRQRHPDLRLAVTAVVPADAEVVASVAAIDARTGAAFDPPSRGTEPAWPPIERFRLRGGVVAEHWGKTNDDVLRQSLLRLETAAMPAAETDLRLVRLTLAPGASLLGVVALGPAAFAVEAGTATLLADGPTVVTRQTTPGVPPVGAPMERLAETPLQPGDQAAIPPQTTYVLHNDHPQVAVVLGVVAFPAAAEEADRGSSARPGMTLGLALFADGAASPRVPWPRGVTVQQLGGGEVSPWPPDAVVVVARFTVGPDSAAALPAGPGLVVVEAGRCVLAPTPAAGETLRGGDGARIGPGQWVLARNVGDEAAVVLSVAIVADQPG